MMLTPAENRRRIAQLQAVASARQGTRKAENRNNGTPTDEARRRLKGGK